jgi:hypothetical protein
MLNRRERAGSRLLAGDPVLVAIETSVVRHRELVELRRALEAGVHLETFLFGGCPSRSGSVRLAHSAASLCDHARRRSSATIGAGKGADASHAPPHSGAVEFARISGETGVKEMWGRARSAERWTSRSATDHASWSTHALDDLDQLVHAVAVVAGELDELLRSLDDGSTLGRPCDRDAASAPELEESLVAEHP